MEIIPLGRTAWEWESRIELSGVFLGIRPHIVSFDPWGIEA